MNKYLAMIELPTILIDGEEAEEDTIEAVTKMVKDNLEDFFNLSEGTLSVDQLNERWTWDRNAAQKT